MDEDFRALLTSRYRGIATMSELDAAKILRACDWLDSHPYECVVDLLDQISLRDLHKRMFEDVWTWAGKLRRTETNIGVTPEAKFSRTGRFV